MEKVEKTIAIIQGPTASGKSALALAMARAEKGTVINADAMQLYAELRILTARPTPEEEAEAPHRLYGVLKAAEASSAGKWLALAKAEIEAAWAEGRLPILVGGTGMYLKILTQGIAGIPAVPPEIRARVWEWAEAARGDGESLHARLAACDPMTAARLAPGDTQRLSRALEVWEATGRPLLAWQADPVLLPFPDAEFRTVTMEVARDELYRRCDLRFEHMLRAGAIEEVRALLAEDLPPHLPACRAVGVPEITRHLRGEWTEAQMIEKAKQATRNYAKRQLTWLRNQLPAS